MAQAFPTMDEEAPSTPPSRPLGRSNRRAGYVTASAPRAMSSSAAKRRSVLALGSIQHLQHFYAKQKPADASAAPHPLARPLPALGKRGNAGPAPLQISEEDEEGEDGDSSLPPTPLPPDRVELKPYEDVEKEDLPTLEVAWREVDDICRRWGLVEHVKATNRAPSMSAQLSQDGHPLVPVRSHSPTPPSSTTPSPDQNLVLSLLTATTAAIRICQRYVLALPPVFPDASTPDYLSNGVASLAVNDSPLTVRHNSSLGVSTAARPRTSVNALPKSVINASARVAGDDPLSALRRASLEVLTALKEMEVRFRLAGDRGASPIPSESALSDEDEQYARMTSPVEGVESGHLYRDDVTLDDLRPETFVVREWLETADRVLTSSAALDTRASMSPIRPSLDASAAFSTALPEWAQTSRFADRPLEQVHALLSAFLPSSLRPRLGAAPDAQALLDSLADGQLLCLAYNNALRSSRRPWGFVPPNAIHDLTASSASVAVGRTFRRFENLRVLAAALSLRYGISLGGTAREQRAKSAPPQPYPALRSFDARTVARRDPGWTDQLEALVVAWCEAVVRETVEAEL